MKFFRRLLIALALSVGAGSAVRADVIELHDGTRIETESIVFEDGLVRLDDGRSFPRDEVKRISFAHGSVVEKDGASGAGSDVQVLLRKAAAAKEKYPDVGAITLIDDGAYTLRPDGTQVERQHVAMKILKEPFKSAANIGHSYEEGRSRATLVMARSISPDGTVHPFDPAELVESKPAGGMMFYNEYRAVSGQLDEVEIGSIVEYIWELETYNPYDKNLFFPQWYFVFTEPSLWSRVRIRVPKDRELNWEVRHVPEAHAEPVVSEKGEYRVYTWEMRDIEHIVSEPSMPPIGEVVPHLRASLFDDWDYLFDFLGKFQREHVQVTPEIEAKVAEIVGEASDPEEIVAKLYHWLQRENRYISIKGSMGSGWGGHPAALTLKNKYGDCIDKAILFTAMLRCKGIKASPVILSTNNTPADDRSLPTLYGNHAITKVYLGEKPIYLDCTAATFRYPYFRPDDYGVTTINVLEGEIGYVDMPPPEHNQLTIGMDLQLDVEGNVDAVVDVDMTGAIEAMLRAGLEQINVMLRKMVAQQLINQLAPGAELKDIRVSDEKDLTKPLTLTLEARLPEYPTFAGELMIFKLPLTEFFTSFPDIALDERKFDIVQNTSGRIIRRFKVHLPPDYVPKGLPEPIELDAPWATYRATYVVDGDTIKFEDRLTQKGVRRIDVKDYARYREFYQGVAEAAKVPLFLYRAQSDPT